MKHLSRDQMKKVMGGNPPVYGCVVICGNNWVSFPVAICSCEDAYAVCSSGGYNVLNCSCSNTPCS